MEKERFAILELKNRRKVMKKEFKKHNLKILEVLPVERATLIVLGCYIPDDKADDLKNLELYLVEGTMESYKNYCEDPSIGIIQHTTIETYYHNNEEES